MRALILFFTFFLLAFNVTADIFKDFPDLKSRLVLVAATSDQVYNELVNNPQFKNRALVNSSAEYAGGNEFYVYLTYRHEKIKQIPPCTIKVKVLGLPTETGVRFETNELKAVCTM